MESSTVTIKGQVTIPSKIRKQLGIHAGDQIEFVEEGDRVYLMRKEDRIEAAFGLFKPSRSASQEEIEQAIAAGWKRHGSR
jgi:AbrB family looped-hinge helix DNA binding protein